MAEGSLEVIFMVAAWLVISSLPNGLLDENGSLNEVRIMV